MSDETLDPQTRAVLDALDRLHPVEEDDDEDDFDPDYIGPVYHPKKKVVKESAPAPQGSSAAQPQTEVESVPQPAEKKRGGQPGNLNALKHGLYLANNRIYNTNPIERSQLCDFSALIEHFKTYSERLYALGMKSNDLAEVNMTLRSLALAGMALTRLINTHNEFSDIRLSSEFYDEKKRTVTRYSFIKGLLNNVSSFIDVDDIEDRIKDLERDDRHPVP